MDYSKLVNKPRKEGRKGKEEVVTMARLLMDAITVLGWLWFVAAGAYFVFSNFRVLRLLPKKVIFLVLSLTSLGGDSFWSLVVSAVRSVAESDEVWTHFLPSDYHAILAQAVHPLVFSSKKELYLLLCDSILVEGGLKSFSLEKHSGAKCYTLSARGLSIAWGDNCDYWRWVSLPESRFEQVAELSAVCWLHITGKMDSRALSPRTYYKAYMIFKLTPGAYGLTTPPQQASAGVGPHITENLVCLQPVNQPAASAGALRRRNDGWTEIELGEFYNADGSSGEVTMSFRQVAPGWKRGLIVEGIQLRPR